MRKSFRTMTTSRGAAVAFLGLMLGMAAAPIALAQRNDATKAEIATLPQWCHSTQSFDTTPTLNARYRENLARYGSGWSHVHHYCWALLSIGRIDRFGNGTQERQGHTRAAVADIDYVLDKVDSGFVLWAEMMAKKIRLLSRMREFDTALKVSEQMVNTLPESAEGYGLQAETLMLSGSRAQAIQVLIGAEKKVKDIGRLDQYRKVLGL